MKPFLKNEVRGMAERHRDRFNKSKNVERLILVLIGLLLITPPICAIRALSTISQLEMECICSAGEYGAKEALLECNCSRRD